MDDSDRLKLKEMIKANNTEDFTEKIRTLKHSAMIRADVQAYLDLCRKYPKSQNDRFFKETCNKKCAFMMRNYTDIYIKMIKNELNLEILNSLLNVLKEIEDGKLDQHEASFKVGKVLKELYIDTALRKGAKLDAAEERRKVKANKGKPQKKPKNISYADYKRSLEKKQSKEQQ
jgi:hypothetical protein